MANKEIPELTAAATLDGTELVHVVQGSNSRRTTVDGINWINALTDKTTPVDADELRIADSAASFGFKKLSFANLKAWVLSFLPVTKYFESAEQTITLSGSLTLAHGLGVEPKNVQFYLICKTAELGYSVGNKVHWGTQIFTNTVGSNTGFTTVVDATDIRVRYSGGGFVIPNFNTGTYAAITNGNWRLIARAMA